MEDMENCYSKNYIFQMWRINFFLKKINIEEKKFFISNFCIFVLS